MKGPPTIHLIAAARPNFMKVAPLYHELARSGWCRPVLIHTGQHYDDNMSGTFLRDLGLPPPDIHLGAATGSHAEQTASVMVTYERACVAQRPDWTVVVGDVNSTLACALAATKLSIPVAHLEAGLRSGDRTMPEEINRILTDAIADLLWTPSVDADENLRTEGVQEARIVRVGNIMIDSYELLRDKIEIDPTRGQLGLCGREYGVVTLHRPSNVDRRESLAPIVEALCAIGRELPLVFPVHPRTRKSLSEHGLSALIEAGVTTLPPLSYIAFMGLVQGARAVITDSGGIQEETTYLGIPCLTLRTTTERPITVSEGTNRLVRTAELLPTIQRILGADSPIPARPEYWDGRTSMRVAESLRTVIGAAAVETLSAS